ncbi:uncharacterized protein LOC103845324 isoform X2 [Brassica rapa]|uniref:uncharacterized protein LOC103845324 isoform X2 n=1 Tax=Brassica campestris TaxID=3711 RepID=UPI00142D29B9|nr:uncharacterized protein LOC103845324 isoform X2 [Brassica rapa]
MAGACSSLSCEFVTYIYVKIYKWLFIILLYINFVINGFQGAYNHASVAMATYQVSVQGHGVSAATLTQGQWYQQPYQQYYQNYIGDYMQQQPIQYQSFAPQNQDAYNEASVAMATTQASIAIPSSQASAQSHGVSAATLTQVQWYQQPYHQYYENYVGDYMQQQQPMQLQSFAPQNQVIYVQVQPRVHHVAQTDQSQMQPQPQVKSQSLTMHQPHDAFSSPKDNTVQDSLAQNTIGQCQSNQPHASWTGLNPQPNQTNQVESPPNNMFEYHEDHFPEQVTHVHPPQHIILIQKQQSLLTSQLTRDQYTMQQVLKYGGASVPESSYMHSLHQLILSNPSLPQKQTAASTTDVVHNQMHQEGPSYNLDIALQDHQPIPTILGVQPNMIHFSATAPQVGLGHAAPSLQRIPKQVHWPPLGPNKVIHIYGDKDDEAVMEGSISDSTNDLYNVLRAAEETTIKLDHKHKRKLTEACDESVHRSRINVEGSEIKIGPLGKQVMEENVGNGWEDLGKSLLVDVGNGWEDLGKSILVEKKGINDDPSLDGTLLTNPSLLNQDGLPQLSNLPQHYLTIAEKSRGRSAKSLDRGFDQRSSVRSHEKHETGFELRPTLRSSQPSMDLGEGQFRHGQRSPICEHLGMPSHGYGPSGGRFALHRSEFKGLGNLQIGEQVISGDKIGPVDSNNGFRLGDVGSQSIYTLQGYHVDDVSFPGDWATKPFESLDFHSQSKEHQQKSMDMVSTMKHNEKKHKMAPLDSSQFGNQNKNEEGRLKGSGEKEENRSIVYHQY